VVKPKKPHKPARHDQHQADKQNADPPAPLKNDEPPPKCHDREGSHGNKHPLDWATFAFVVVASIAAAFAAVFTHQQVVVARDSEHRQLRAYIGDIVPEKFYAITTDHHFGVHLDLRNAGQTPAYDVTHAEGIEIESYPLPPEAKIIEKTDEHALKITIHPSTVANEGIYVKTTESVGDQKLEAIKLGQSKRLYLWGVVHYRDAFDDMHYTHFCINIYGDFAAGPVGYERCPIYNDAN
jgi:hypothetical protein